MFAAAPSGYTSPAGSESLALNQLSEDDRRLVARLKSLYPSHILGSVFQEGQLHNSETRWSQSTAAGPSLTVADQAQSWTNAPASSRDSTSSTLYMGSSIDGDACCSSRTSRSSNNSIAEKAPLWKQRAASVSRITTASTAPIKPLGPPRSRRGMSESKSVRLQLRPKPMQIAPLASIETITVEPTPLTPAISVHALYFCTNCEESFQERTEWQEHEYEVHQQQFYWVCSDESCDQVFTASDVFSAHYRSAHGLPISQADLDNKRPLPSKRSWACGFDRCKGVFNDWEERCEHVAGHFDGLARLDDAAQHSSEWKYTNVLRNLLRQPDIKEAYKRMMVKLHGDDKVFWPKMRWQVENSSELLRKLEYRDFREGVMEIARVACQLGHPACSNVVKIAVEPVEDVALAPSLLHQNNSFLHIDKFPTPGQNPFDLYGPVPPSPIVQLDFPFEQPFVEAPAEYTSSRKSSLAHNPYSLYPSPALETPPLPPPKSSTPPVFSPVSEVHPLTSPAEVYSFQTATTWATAYSTAGDASPPRPKTPMSVIRSAKSLLRKRSQSKLSRPSSAEEKFDSLAAQQTIASYTSR